MKIKVLHLETQTEIKELNLTHILREGESCFIGRSQNSSLILDSPSVSRLHARVSYHHGQYYFCDLGSSNGSLVKSEKAIVNQDYLLQPGDVIRLGDFVLLLEATPELSDDPAETVIGDLDATIISGYTHTGSLSTSEPPDRPATQEDAEPVIVAELVKNESSALVKIDSPEVDYSLQSQTQALFTAINQRVLAELRAAGNLTRDTYLKAIGKARESIEHDRLIDPDQFEKEAEKYWQSLAKNTSELGARLSTSAAKAASNFGSRLSAAAKAAWGEFVAHRPEVTKQRLNVPEKQEFFTLDTINQSEGIVSKHKLDQPETSTAESESSDN